MIKNIVFDMGQVLIKFDPYYFIKEIGITDKKDIEILYREVYKSLEWSMMDRGTITDQEGAEMMCKRIPDKLHDAVRKLTYDWFRPMLSIDGMEDLCKQLKANGYKLYLLSNASYLQKSYWPRVPGHQYFDGRIVSAEVGYVKPEKEIFKILCDTYNLKKEECVFIDDSTLNCEAAYGFGMSTIVFHDDSIELIDKLENLGINTKKAF